MIVTLSLTGFDADEIKWNDENNRQKGRVMNKRITGCIIMSCILTAAFNIAVYAGTSESGPKVAIAWNNRQDTYSFTSLITTMEETGVDYEILDMVQSYDLSYDEDGKLIEAKDENGILTPEAAKLVKNNTWIGSNAEELMEGVDCIIFSGGSDISPTLFYEEQEWHGIEADKDYCAERDVSDYILMSYCLEHDVPILAICRGMQMLSTVSGAEVIQDLKTYFADSGVQYQYKHSDPEKRDLVPHPVDILTSDSILYDVYGTLHLEGCPSWHHQAVKDVSNTRLVVTAQAETDGTPVIEAVERHDQTFCLGVQFHPEVSVRKAVEHEENAGDFMDYDTSMAVFYTLIEAGDSHQKLDQAA